MEYITLSNGVKMPTLGYGVFLVSPEECERCVSDALSVGYRLIDTAQAYQNEEGVGNVWRKSGIKREDLFLVTKVWISNAGEEQAAKSIDESLRKLQTEYIDLSKYDTVFIGGPVWWGTYPQVMFTFFKKHANDLKGKTVIPFTTHEGSGLANCVEDVKDAFPGANVQKGFSIYGHEVRTEKKKVEKWLNSLGY